MMSKDISTGLLGVHRNLKLAFFLKTAPSCHQADWDGLEDDYLTVEELGLAKADPADYAAHEICSHYPAEIKHRIATRPVKWWMGET